MTNFKKVSGFITLTIVLIIVLLITAVALMTGRMLMGEQRTISNTIRYHEAKNSAQYGLDLAAARLMTSIDNRNAISSASGTDSNYQVTFGTEISIPLGSRTIPVIPVQSIGYSGYSASASNADSTAEAKVTLREEFVGIPSISGAPAAPITVAAGSAIGGNLTVVANPNGGGPGVPLSVWSKANITLADIGGSFVSCGLQEYYNQSQDCTNLAYTDKTKIGSDIVSNDTTNFPPNLLAYVFAGAQNMAELINDTKLMYPSSGTDGYVMRIGDNQISPAATVCDNLINAAGSAFGRYIIKGGCDFKKANVIGSQLNPVQLVIWDGDLTFNSNTEVWGIVFTYSEDSSATYTVQLEGTPVLHGVFVSNYQNQFKGTGNFNAVYDAKAISNLNNNSQPITAIVPGSWRDW